jgi:TPR repeat protein
MQYKTRNGAYVWMIITALALIAVIVGGYWLFRDHAKETLPPAQAPSLPKMANLPRNEPAIKPPPKPTYAPDAPVLEQARQALREGITPADAFAMAATLPDKPERADAAFLLLEYAAESGNAGAAMAVGGYYDPSVDLPSGSIRKNPARAFEWYQTALAAGHTEAGSRLASLRRWVVASAEKGSADAQALLENWP